MEQGWASHAADHLMQLAFCLYKYFPFGGLQRDFLRIARICVARGHVVRVFTLEWQGERPEGLEIEVVPVRGLTSPARYRRFTAALQRELATRPADRVVGFNKMPGLDFYYAADPCYAEKAQARRGRLYRLSGRYRHFMAYERAVFEPQAKTQIMMLSTVQLPLFVHHYGTPPERIHLLPPGVATDRRAPPDADRIRAATRSALGIDDEQLVVLQIGSGFRTKGLGRSLTALAALPAELRHRTRLLVIGQDDPGPYRAQARVLGIGNQVTIVSGRDDIPQILLAADLLIHPAHAENTGTVLLEAVVAGLPVLTTAVCGYAHYVVEADAGRVLTEPFAQAALNGALAVMLRDDQARTAWSRNGLAWADTADIYGLHERAADIILGDEP